LDLLSDFQSILVTILLFLVAVLYSSVGHAGASGYLAVMGLVGISAAVMRPTALALNIIVAVITTYKYYRAGSLSWRLFLPLAITSIPFAFLGGRIVLPEVYYKPLVGLILVFSDGMLIRQASNGNDYIEKKPYVLLLFITGSILGFLSGLTGVGGGIFLSPLLIFLHWAPIKVISGVSAGFVLVNSIAAFLGVASLTNQFHNALPVWLIVVVIGGFIGAEYGSRRLGNNTIQRLLAIVLFIAGVKMILMM